MRVHGLWMVIGCTLPLFVIFLLPLLGVSSNVGTFMFILLMFACHLLAMRGHGEERSGDRRNREGRHGSH